MSIRRSASTPKRLSHTVVAAVVLLAIIAATLIIIYITYRQGIRPKAFFARSINDASYDCEHKINERFGSRLISKYYDQFSSRYDADEHQYIIYYRVSAEKRDRNNIPSIHNYMAKCIVWEKLGYVSTFQVFDNFQ